MGLEDLERDFGPTPPPPAVPAPPAESSQDIIGRWKARHFGPRMMTDPEADLPGLRHLKKPKRHMATPPFTELLPGSIPEAAATGASLIPGAGIVPILGRAALAMGATAGAEELLGGDPAKALEAGASSLVGGALGGLGRGAYRLGRSLMDKTTQQVTRVIGRAVPEYAGRSAEETVDNIITGRGLQRVRKAYGDTLGRLFKQHGDPDVVAPSLAAAKGDPGNVAAGAGPASILLDQIKDLRRNLRTALGDVTRRKDALQKLGLLDDAEQEIEQGLARTWPKPALDEFEGIRPRYRAAMEIQRWWGGGRERLTPQQIEKLVTPDGKVNLPFLQAMYKARQAKLEGALGTAAEDLRGALLRGNPNPLARDIPAQAPRVGGHVYPGGASVYPRGLPHAPRLAGEGPTSEHVAQALRVLGVKGTEEALGE